LILKFLWNFKTKFSVELKHKKLNWNNTKIDLNFNTFFKYWFKTKISCVLWCVLNYRKRISSIDKISDLQGVVKDFTAIFLGHFRFLYENLNFWSKLAWIFFVSTYVKNEKKNKSQLRPKIQIFIYKAEITVKSLRTPWGSETLSNRANSFF
jgi:hypothetical protein